MKNITLETIYKKVNDLQRDVAQIKKKPLRIPGVTRRLHFTDERY